MLKPDSRLTQQYKHNTLRDVATNADRRRLGIAHGHRRAADLSFRLGDYHTIRSYGVKQESRVMHAGCAGAQARGASAIDCW
jgi:hypothetical protein